MLPFSKAEDDPENDDADTLRMARAVTDHLPDGLTFDDMCPLSGDAQGLVQQLMHPDQQMRLDVESLKKQCAVGRPNPMLTVGARSVFACQHALCVTPRPACAHVLRLI